MGSTPPPLHDHSQAKLKLIAQYLESYFPAVLVHPAQSRQRITLVDGFCGGGKFVRDEEYIKGTPFLFLEAVEKAEQQANLGRTKKLSIDAEFHFVDSKKDHIEFLRNELVQAGYLAKIDRSIFLHHREFEDVFPEISRRIEERTRNNVGRSIFLLDQLGYTDVTFETVRKILRFSAAECILTFAVGWLIDYLSDKPQVLQRVAPIELTPEQIYEYLHLKGEWGGRYAIQRLLLRHISQSTGANFQSPFFLRSREARKDLWLVHLSQHLKARNVMVDSHWLINNTSLHQGHGGLEMLGFDPNIDQSGAPDFWFGTNDNIAMRDRLAEDFLKRIRDRHADAAISYHDFIKSIANETPARLSDLNSVTSLLVEERELDLRNEYNTTKRSSTPSNRDTIAIARQPKLWSFAKAQ
ncbi:three-Cys-motif partner protein TcmP [Brucella endophytica]|uniref:three-Cys-motif partner protein TcmP n=1 Tax=Brucella endophytica TaxID=1963359 RepID=UPI0022A70D6B